MTTLEQNIKNQYRNMIQRARKGKLEVSRMWNPSEVGSETALTNWTAYIGAKARHGRAAGTARAFPKNKRSPVILTRRDDTLGFIHGNICLLHASDPVTALTLPLGGSVDTAEVLSPPPVNLDFIPKGELDHWVEPTFVTMSTRHRKKAAVAVYHQATEDGKTETIATAVRRKYPDISQTFCFGVAESFKDLNGAALVEKVKELWDSKRTPITDKITRVARDLVITDPKGANPIFVLHNGTVTKYTTIAEVAQVYGVNYVQISNHLNSGIPISEYKIQVFSTEEAALKASSTKSSIPVVAPKTLPAVAQKASGMKVGNLIEGEIASYTLLVNPARLQLAVKVGDRLLTIENAAQKEYGHMVDAKFRQTPLLLSQDTFPELIAPDTVVGKWLASVDINTLDDIVGLKVTVVVASVQQLPYGPSILLK
jgi:hypothetical protein